MYVKVVCRLCSSKDTNSYCVFNSYESVTKLSWRDIIHTTIGLEINKEDLVSQKICIKCGKDLIKLYEFRERCLKNDRLLKDLQKKTSPQNAMHPSVIEIFNTYPGIKLPNMVLRSNFSSTVEMELDGVENYFKQNNINMNKHLRQMMKSDTSKQKNERLQECASITSKETVSPISIKFKNDRSGYEIVQKSSYYHSDDGKLQNEILDLIKCSSSNESIPQNEVFNMKMLQSGKLNDKTSSPRILSNIILKPADFLKQPVEETIPFSDSVSGISLLPNGENDNDGLVTKIEYSESGLKCMDDDMETVLCEFCKNSFKNEIILSAHLKMCFFKKAIENVPDVLVERVENDESLKIMYRQALENLKKTNISPEIEISNSQFPNLNFKTDTNNFIQQLLTSQCQIEQNTQTEFDQLKTSCSNNKTPIELKGFKSYLDLYKVPVSIKYGEKFEVNFNLNNPQVESTSKFEDWSKLVPVDVPKTKNSSKNIEDTFDPLKNLDLDMEIDEDTIKQLLDSVNTSITKCDNIPDIPENNTSIPENSTNINFKIPSLGPSLPPYPSIHDNNFNINYQTNNRLGHYLPPPYMDNTRNNNSFTSFDQQFQNYINVNVNVYNNNKESRNKTPHNSTSTMKTNRIWHPPVMQSNELAHTFNNNRKNTNSTFNDKERQLYMHTNQMNNFKSIPSNVLYNSFHSHPYYNIPNYHQNLNYRSNNNCVNMPYGNLQNSSHNSSDSSGCDLNLSSIRVRPISDLK